jgi:hypothetical protein
LVVVCAGDAVDRRVGGGLGGDIELDGAEVEALVAPVTTITLRSGEGEALLMGPMMWAAGRVLKHLAVVKSPSAVVNA